jgi:septal ring factor EnvC (AmiA/AmiB activator)
MKIAIILILAGIWTGLTTNGSYYAKPYRQSDYIKTVHTFGIQKGNLLSYSDSANIKSESIEVELKTGAPVYSIADGTVIEVCDTCDETRYGNYVVIEFEGSMKVKYYYLEKVYLKTGQKVKKEEKIGLSGTTGMTTVNGLGIRLEKNGTPLDPNKLLHLY